MKKIIVVILLISIALTACNEKKSGAGGVYFKYPTDRAEVTSPVKVLMGVDGKILAPAGEVKEGEGHHHIIVDGGPIPTGDVVPADATHIHYGKAQIETELVLPPGQHTLTLQFADGAHRSFGPEYSKTITIDVKEGKSREGFSPELEVTSSPDIKNPAGGISPMITPLPKME